MELEPILPSPVDTKVQMTGPPDAESGSNSSRAETLSPAQERPNTVPALVTTQVAQVATDDTSSTAALPQTQSQAQSSNPQIADDVDVIEKEWVDKAKSIVSSTKDSPHMQEKEVSKLQADYLMKRYGKQIKTVD